MASEYGWAKADILENVYFDELYFLQEEILSRKTAEYKMQVAIFHSTDAKAMFDSFDADTGSSEPRQSEKRELDKSGMNLLKMKISGQPGSHMIVK